MSINRFFAIGVACSLAACSESNSPVAPIVQPQATATTAAASLGHASLTIVIPRTVTPASVTKRKPAYVSSGTTQIVLVVNNARPNYVQPQPFTVSSSSCNESTASYSCTIIANVPIGNDDITISAKDSTNDILSTQRAFYTVAAVPATSTFAVTLDANTASIAAAVPASGVTLSSGCPSNGTTISGTGILTDCTATLGNKSAQTFTISLSDLALKTIPDGAGFPTLSASSSDTSKFTVATSSAPDAITITPVACNAGSATITITATPANTAGTLPGDGLGAVSLTFSVTTQCTPTKIFLTSGTSYVLPNDWNPSNNTIEAIGGGGGGTPETQVPPIGGGGGGYAKISNFSATAGSTITYKIGSGGAAGAGYYSQNPYVGGFDGGSTCVYDGPTCGLLTANGGKGSGAGGGGSVEIAYMPGVTFTGGTGQSNDQGSEGAGGGGAAGPNGKGGNGSGNTGGTGDNGAGGVDGSPGTEFGKDSQKTPQSYGSGGGGDGAPARAAYAGAGGNYGAGGGGGLLAGAAGANGLIVLTYTP